MYRVGRSESRYESYKRWKKERNEGKEQKIGKIGIVIMRIKPLLHIFRNLLGTHSVLAEKIHTDREKECLR